MKIVGKVLLLIFKWIISWALRIGVYLIDKLQRVLLPYKIITGFLFGALVGVLIIFYDWPFIKYSDPTWEFIKAPSTRYWFALAILSLGLCGAIVLPLFEWVWSLRKVLYALSWKSWVGMLVWILAIGLLAYIPLTTVFSYRCDYLHILPNSWRKAWYLGLSVYATLILAGIGMLSVSYAAKHLHLISRDAQSDDLFNQYISLKENAFRLLAVFVINITLYPLTIRAKLNAISTLCAPDKYVRLDMYKDNPKVYLAYGAFFSLLLLLTYVPAYICLHDAGKKLCNVLLPMPSIQTPEWDTWYEKRQKVEGILGVNKSLTETLLTTVTILIPFITGVYTFLTSK